MFRAAKSSISLRISPVRFQSSTPKFNPQFLQHTPKFNPSLLSSSTTTSTTTTKSTDSHGMSSDEMSHFETLAPTWWDARGSQRILHMMNLSRMDFINDVLQKHKVQLPNARHPDLYVPRFNTDVFPSEISRNIANELSAAVHAELCLDGGMRVLDIGCGGGLLSESMARLPFVKSVEGIDMTSGVIKVARDHMALDPMLKEKLSYELCSLAEHREKTKNATYDIVTMFEMLEHVDNPREMLNAAWDRVSANGGMLFISTINRDLISWFTTIFMGEEVLKIVPKGTHHLSKYINNTEISQWFAEQHPFTHKVLDCKGTMYVPTQGWVNHSCKDIGNYYMAIQKIQ